MHLSTGERGGVVSRFHCEVALALVHVNSVATSPLYGVVVRRRANKSTLYDIATQSEVCFIFFNRPMELHSESEFEYAWKFQKL